LTAEKCVRSRIKAVAFERISGHRFAPDCNEGRGAVSGELLIDSTAKISASSVVRQKST